ncbi:MAG TPA: helix-turn-helix transcriptional regulator [Kofleriaceae bacterium]|nr:helix-turn-helix transcriptional regulator [Kofleriaceae bacterium]
MQADAIIEAATYVCDESRRRGAEHCSVQFHFGRTPTLLTIDNVAASVVDDRANRLDVPLIGPRSSIGSVLFTNPTPIAIDLERSLTMLVTELSVWCAEHGIDAISEHPIELPPRQYDIAQLAARGLTNVEIAQHLHISVNTVKVRLKQVFARLDASNRTELVHRLGTLSPLQNVPVGTTRARTVTITRRSTWESKPGGLVHESL